MFQMLTKDGKPVKWEINNFSSMMQWVMVWLLRQLPEEQYPGHAAYEKAHPDLVRLRKRIEAVYGSQLVNGRKAKSGRMVVHGAIALAVLKRLDSGQTVDQIEQEKITLLLREGRDVQKEFNP